MSQICYGQIILGPPGSGKTTYCNAIRQLLTKYERNVIIINLDPANDEVPYDVDIDINNLVNCVDVMKAMHLGPNGGLVYCMEFLEKNLDWLTEQICHVIQNRAKSNSTNNCNNSSNNTKTPYLLIDCPGQVELYTSSQCVRNIIGKLVNSKNSPLDLRLTCVYLVDSHYCTDAGKFISALMSTLIAMLHLEMPHVNLLSKCDLLEKYSETSFSIDYYSEVLDLSYLVDTLSGDKFYKKYHELTSSIAETVESYGLVSFIPISSSDSNSLWRALCSIDRANGQVLE